MLNNIRYYDTKAAFDAEKSSFPRPCVASYKQDNDLWVFYRHSSSSVPDTLYTVGTSRFHLGHSIIGGQSLLGATKHTSQATVPTIL